MQTINAVHARWYCQAPVRRHHALAFMKKFVTGIIRLFFMLVCLSAYSFNYVLVANINNYLGNAHKCEAYVEKARYIGDRNMLILYSCRKSDELHDKRHREIARLLQNLNRLDHITVQADSSQSLTRKKRTRKSELFDLSSIRENFEYIDNKGDEWADSSTVCDEDLDIGKMPLIDTKESSEITKTQRSHKKFIKNQKRFQVVTVHDMNRINGALHLVKHPLLEGVNERMLNTELAHNSMISPSISFNARISPNLSVRQGALKKSISATERGGKSSLGGMAPSEDQLTDILARLGVDIDTPAKNPTKEHKIILQKLRDAISKDHIIVKNEEREIMMRMAGYWRYANKRTYNHMVRNNQLWDWATGAKLPEIDEGSEVDDDDTFSQQDTDIGTPMENYDEDFIWESEDQLQLKHQFTAVTESITNNGPSNDLATTEPTTPTPVKRDSSPQTPRPFPSPWHGKKDTRHLPTPSPPANSPASSTSSTRMTKSTAHHHHLDSSNRFSPLAFLPRSQSLTLSPIVMHTWRKGRGKGKGMREADDGWVVARRGKKG